MTFEIFGHRGTNPYPDHSAEAHSLALDWGADWAEFDIQMTSDGVLVVAHDTGTIPTTTLARLQATSPGTMTLDQALDLVARKEAETGRDIKISIEMKNPATHAARGLDMPKALVDLLVARGITRTEDISVSSFDTSATQRLANALYPAAGISTSIDYVATSFTGVNLANVAKWADTISVGTANVSADLVAKAHAAGLKVYVWTHAGPGEELQRFIDMGVDGVYSDNTRVAREYVDAAEGLNTVYGGTGGSIVSGTDGNDVVYGLQGNDTLLGGAGHDVLNGDGGNDVVVAGADGSTLRGGGGNDVLFGGAGADTLAGGVGNDAIVAGATDTIRYAAGDGIDLIDGAGSAVVVEGIASAAIAVSTLNGDLVVSFADGGAMVFEAGALPGSIAFADGVSLTGAELAALATGTAPAGIAAAVAALEAARAAAEPARSLPLAPNLIQNGSFENIDGTEVRDWGRYDPDGVMPGWVNLASGRVEQHQDTVSGVKAVDGAYWTDLDGWQNNVKLAQTVEGVQKGATYQLSFQIADTDLKDAEKLTVTYGGVVVYSGAPKGAVWETVSVSVVGGSGNGSDTLVFSQTGGKLDGAGLALDNVAMIKTAEAPAGVGDGNLIVNGGFENINGTEYRDWGRYSPDGVMPGWENLGTGRVEQHRDTVSGVGAAVGEYWTDLDGWQNNVQLAQDVDDVVKGATYRLSFQIADTDLKDSESLTVTFGGKTVYEGAPKGAAWETISVEVMGGSGDGSDRLVFAQTGGKLDGAGLALDDVSMVKTADPYVQHFDFQTAQTWSQGTPWAGFNATFSYTLTEQDLAGGSARAWEVRLGYEGGTITNAWMNGHNAAVALGTDETGTKVLTTDGMGYQRSLVAGDTISFTVQGSGADFDTARAAFSFADVDTVPDAMDPQGMRIDAAATNDWGTGLSQSVALLNEGGKGIDGWTVELDLPSIPDFNIVSVWGAAVEREADGDLLFRALDYNASVGAGGRAEFGFIATHAATGEAVAFADGQFSFVGHSDHLI